MRKKQSVSILLICFLCISTPNINVNAVTYLIGVSTDSEMTLAVNVLDESTIRRDFMASLMTLYLGFKFQLIREEQIVFGAQTKWKVTRIIEGVSEPPHTGWEVLFSVWNWTGGFAANNDSYRFVFVNEKPSDVTVPFMCAKPVSIYINETSVGSSNTLSGTTVTRNISYLSYDFIFEYQWDENTGLLRSFKILYQGKVILELSPPVFNLFIPILIGVGVAGIIGVVYIFYKRRS